MQIWLKCKAQYKKDFWGFVHLSSVKKFRRRISFDPYPPDIVKYRNLRPPSPPKKVRRLLWTAPYILLDAKEKKLPRQKSD